MLNFQCTLIGISLFVIKINCFYFIVQICNMDTTCRMYIFTLLSKGRINRVEKELGVI
uniref:Hypothetical secreted peptide n=1 Tax=Glossina morsitans morsitans TaxID=37546 RepID=D3TST4_GLOMM